MDDFAHAGTFGSLSLVSRSPQPKLPLDHTPPPEAGMNFQNDTPLEDMTVDMS